MQIAAEERAAQQLLALRTSLEERLERAEAARASALEQLAHIRQQLTGAEAQHAALNMELEQSRCTFLSVYSVRHNDILLKALVASRAMIEQYPLAPLFGQSLVTQRAQLLLSISSKPPAFEGRRGATCSTTFAALAQQVRFFSLYVMRHAMISS